DRDPQRRRRRRLRAARTRRGAAPHARRGARGPARRQRLAADRLERRARGDRGARRAAGARALSRRRRGARGAGAAARRRRGRARGARALHGTRATRRSAAPAVAVRRVRSALDRRGGVRHQRGRGDGVRAAGARVRQRRAARDRRRRRDRPAAAARVGARVARRDRVGRRRPRAARRARREREGARASRIHLGGERRPARGDPHGGRLMCGIVGAVLAGGGDVRLDDAVACLEHRGPDQNAAWREGEARLGFRRLAIIDLSEAGHQPMHSPDGRYVIVFNGEIYNFRELRDDLEARGERFRGHSDTEVLLRLFAREGQERCLSLARDRLGVKPLVYAETPGAFLFGSEIQALFALEPGLSREPDFEGLDHYLTFQYVPAPRSGFAAVRKLPPAHAMTVRAGRVERVFRYWDLDLTRKSALSFGEACEALREQVLEATRLRLVSDVPLGAFLSGGIDSSITVAAMARLGASP